MKRFRYLLISSILLTSACTTTSNNSAYVSQSHYSDYNCQQIQAEKKRLASKLEQMTETSDKEKESSVVSDALSAAVVGYAISRGYGFRGNQKSDIPFQRMQNQYDVLEKTSIEKECF